MLPGCYLRASLVFPYAPFPGRKRQMLTLSSGCVSERERERYIYIIYTPNLGSAIAVVHEREQGRFRGSIEGAKGSSEGARGSTGEH